MTTGVPAAPARAVPATSGPTAGPGLRRSVLRGLTAALVTVAVGLLPGTAGQAGLGLATFGTVVWTTVWLLRAAPRSAHPRAWWWFAATVGLGGAGAAVATSVVPMGEAALGAVPGQLLVTIAIANLIDRRALRGARGQLGSRLMLFVLADLLTAHTAFLLTFGVRGPLTMTQTVSLFALLLVMALGNGMSLVLVSVTPPDRRGPAWLVFTSQWVTAVAATASAVSTGPGPGQAVACACSVLGMSLLVTACRADVARPDPGRVEPGAGSALGALLPHGIALLGGSLLLVSGKVLGSLTYFGTTLGVLGLTTLFAHQVVSWRAQRKLTADLRRSEAWFRTLVRGSADPVVILDEQLRITWSSPATQELLGFDADRSVGVAIADLVHPDDAAELVTGLSAPQAPDAPGTKTRTARVQHADGRWRLIQARVRDLRTDPDVGALVLYCRDVSRADRQPAAEGELTPLPTTDHETGLPNRSALTQRIGATLRDADASSGLVVLGVDGLPADGDRTVLRELTTRFARALRGDDWLARAGAAEFAVLVDGSVADAETVAARLVAAVGPVTTPGGTVRLTAAAGVATLFPGFNAGEALRRGDLALRSARAAGPGRVRRHSDALRLAQDREEALRADLEHALELDQLHLVYQPVVDLALHRTVSVEALLRWRHPVYGEVSPAEFVPLAEESALITDIGRWVLRTATATAVALPAADLGVAVNVSARHVRSGELVPDVLAALAASGLPADRLILEITESVLLDTGQVAEELGALRRLGVRIAVDDFGTGWSSLAYLVGLPIDLLKMDRQFLADVETHPQRRALCESVLHLGTSLGLAVVVEGVETPGELRLLRDMGHRFIQGFLLSRPLDAATLAARLPAIGDDPAAVAPDVVPGARS
ncbi:EAL domain-containing protein [Modestobacter sp. NPDC049651]|uniref:putative bifunctional diguanylate cyclase/phosphodiesterase n=1 Tax=unclassified Modestobacter TaxID=2643866 RepID=UPI0033CA7BC9